MENYYYIGDIPTDIEALEAVILGTLEQQRVLSNGQIVVELQEGIYETPEILSSFQKYSSDEILAAIDEIENNTK